MDSMVPFPKGKATTRPRLLVQEDAHKNAFRHRAELAQDESLKWSRTLVDNIVTTLNDASIPRHLGNPPARLQGPEAVIASPSPPVSAGIPPPSVPAAAEREAVLVPPPKGESAPSERFATGLPLRKGHDSTQPRILVQEDAHKNAFFHRAEMAQDDSLKLSRTLIDALATRLHDASLEYDVDSPVNFSKVPRFRTAVELDPYENSLDALLVPVPPTHQGTVSDFLANFETELAGSNGPDPFGVGGLLGEIWRRSYPEFVLAISERGGDWSPMSLPPRDKAEIGSVTSWLRTSVGSFTGFIFLFSVHDNDHVLHDCALSNGTCRCRWRQQSRVATAIRRRLGRKSGFFFSGTLARPHGLISSHITSFNRGYKDQRFSLEEESPFPF
ncbi:hypothetical protein JTE90_023427 [Oedothorax gibbosus]|uniref:Uncharacterized protein n=1 Tax=Oedothorax gibbosus TaxID=931172 RepID=A0AAV6TZF2_9ARAC|nr:hypothetical protein JTE90_023427 [Oedothorax gibbosus]